MNIFIFQTDFELIQEWRNKQTQSNIATCPHVFTEGVHILSRTTCKPLWSSSGGINPGLIQVYFCYIRQMSRHFNSYNAMQQRCTALSASLHLMWAFCLKSFFLIAYIILSDQNKGNKS